MENLPHDLITQVLVWLPVKSLLRFRCVSKSWFEYIDSRYFINTRLYNFKMPDITRCSTAYCNGLVLFQLPEHIFYVWNSSTRHYRKLPAFPVDYPHHYLRNCRFKFGYDLTTDDYKVIALVASNTSYVVLIFGLKSGCWRRIQDFPYIEYDYVQYTSGDSFADGCVHFVFYSNPKKRYTIVAFDVEKETFSEVPQPNYDAQIGVPGGLRAFQGRLSIKFFGNGKIDVYVRRKEGVEYTWTKLFSFAIGELIQRRVRLDFRIVGYSKKRDKILLLSHRNTYSYDLKEETLQEIESNNVCCWDSILWNESVLY